MNRDELAGKARAVKGEIEQTTGKFSNDPRLYDKGVIDEVAGRSQDALGHVKRKIREAVDSARRA